MQHVSSLAITTHLLLDEWVTFWPNTTYNHANNDENSAFESFVQSGLQGLVPAISPENFLQHKEPGRYISPLKDNRYNTTNPIASFGRNNDRCFTVPTCQADQFKNFFFVKTTSGITLTTHPSPPSLLTVSWRQLQNFSNCALQSPTVAPMPEAWTFFFHFFFILTSPTRLLFHEFTILTHHQRWSQLHCRSLYFSMGQDDSL